jgi:hypothetical protein
LGDGKPPQYRRCHRVFDSFSFQHHDDFVRTTFSINDAILKELRQLAVASGKSFRSVIEEILILGLAQKTKVKPKKKFRVVPHRLEMKRGLRGLSMNQLYDQVEAEGNTQTR